MAQQIPSIQKCRPFLKWAGGKTQLLDAFGRSLPEELSGGKITNYVEPFMGGGAVFFSLNQQHTFRQRTVCDANEELVLTYRVIKRSVEDLIAELRTLESEYHVRTERERESFYYKVRGAFNDSLPDINFRNYGSAWVDRAARIIFLNRTCYNGLFRVNRKGGFNVPFGRYKKPEILNEDNLRNVAEMLHATRIIHGDFTTCGKFVDGKTFVYLDPPYRPLNRTSSFTSYSRGGFCDEDQMRLAEFFKKIDAKGAKIMLSNSDPRNENPNDSYFDELFADYTIRRVPARRIINCNGSRRGNISELIITNYPVKTV
ncbi:MAG: DNA adenine methylase [Methanoregula sp.]|jgi:DNA adenine methylase|nr:DNA adenine methylase [Methanoregula sp.]